MQDVYKEGFSVEEQDVLYRAESILRSRVLNRLYTVTEPSLVIKFLKMKLAPLQREAFGMLHLDSQHRIIGDQILFYGTIDASPVYPREVVKAAINFNSAAVIFYHNHPSGIAEPSRADRDITERLKTALNTIDIRVLDHIIIGDTHVSFAERSMI